MNSHTVIGLIFYMVCLTLAEGAGLMDAINIPREVKEWRKEAGDVLDQASDLIHGSERVHMDAAMVAGCVSGGIALFLIVCCVCCCCCRRQRAAPQTIVFTPHPYAKV